MKQIFFFITALILSLQPDVCAQLPNGSIAPNWTLTDIEGNTFTLYDYLDQGKMVVLDFGETRCTPCWEYLNSGALVSFWNLHGPNGLNDAMVFFIESNWESGMDDLLGLTPFSNGNWVAACPFPLIDLAPGNNTANDYDVNYYPTLFAVCHDHTLYEFGEVPTQDWIDFLESCNMEVAVSDLDIAICAGDGSVTVEPEGGFSPYNYLWDSGATSASISGLVSNNYTVSVTEGKGKISTLQVFVPGATESLSLSDVVEPALCHGSADGHVFIDVEGGVSGYSYAWSTGATTQNLLNVPSNQYSVTVTDNLGCTKSQSFYVGQPNELEATAAATPVSCAQPDGTITLNISGGTGDYLITASEGNVVGYQILDLSAGTISVTVEDENGCLWSEDIVLPFIDTPVAVVTEGAELTCIDTTTTVSGFASGGYNEFDFQWTTTDGHILSNPLLPDIVVDAPGSYLLHVMDLTSGCETNATSIVADGVIPPEADAGPSFPINCENLQLTLAGSGDSLNVIQWTTQNGSIVSGGDTYHPVINSPGKYVLNVIHQTTQCTHQDSVIIPDESAPAKATFSYLSSSLTLACTDMSTGSHLSGWTWTFGDGHTSTMQNAVHTYDSSGTYQVCLTVQNGCGVNQSCQSVEILFTESALLVEATITNVLCYGDRNGSLSITVSGGSGIYNYNWVGPDTTYTGSSLVDLPAGNYQLIVSDDLGNIYIGSYDVEQPAVLDLVAIVMDPLCHGDANGSIMMVASGGISPYMHQWSVGSSPESAIDSLSAGHYVDTVADANGCTMIHEVVLVEPDVIELDSILITDASGPVAADGRIALLIKGGTQPYTVIWSNGAEGSAIDGLSPGVYDYVITDANGCHYESPEQILVGLATATIEPKDQAYIRIMPNPSAGEIRIQWSSVNSTLAYLTLFSPEGKMLHTHQIHSTDGTWDLSPIGLQEGFYFLQLKMDEMVLVTTLVKL